MTRGKTQERLVERTVPYWDPKKKLNLATFSSYVKPIQTSTKKNEKTETLKYHQDLLSRLITVSRSRYIDLKKVLSYELAPVPLALFHARGEMRQTNKSEILKELAMNSSSYGNLEEICKSQVLLVIRLMVVLQALSKSGLKTFGDMEFFKRFRTSMVQRKQFYGSRSRKVRIFIKIIISPPEFLQCTQALY